MQRRPEFVRDHGDHQVADLLRFLRAMRQLAHALPRSLLIVAFQLVALRWRPSRWHVRRKARVRASLGSMSIDTYSAVDRRALPRQAGAGGAGGASLSSAPA